MLLNVDYKNKINRVERICKKLQQKMRNIKQFIIRIYSIEFLAQQDDIPSVSASASRSG